MNRNRMLLIGIISLALAVGLTYLIYKMLNKGRVIGRVVLVAKEKIPPGSVLSTQDLKYLPWLEGVPPKGSFDDIAKLENRATMVEMQQNDFVFDSKLVPKEGGVGGLTAVIDVNKRAVSVKVDSVIGVAGFVLPGTYVDVILTGQPGANQELTSKVIIENVKVLTADKDLQKDPKGEAKDSRVVTLLLDPEQASKIALASTEGRIQLALRNPQDKEIKNPDPIKITEIYSGRKKKEPPYTPPPSEWRTVTHISGGKIETVKVRIWPPPQTTGRK
jgi:pilus assembly protein CpaB